MELNREEIFFARDLLQVLRNNHIKRFPFQTKTYRQALKQIKENLELTPPLNTLLIPDFPFGNFPRMNNAIQSRIGRYVSILSPHYNEILLDLPYSEVKDPLVKKFTEMFIEELNL